MTSDEAQRRAVSRNVRAEVVRHGRAQSEVARTIGMSESAWYRRMDGRVAWRYDELQAIARELGVKVDELAGNVRP